MKSVAISFLPSHYGEGTGVRSLPLLIRMSKVISAKSC